MEKILNEVKKENLGDKILNFITDNTENKHESVKIKLKPDNVKNFSDFILNVCDELNENKNGLFIVIDDMNGLSDDPNLIQKNMNQMISKIKQKEYVFLVNIYHTLLSIYHLEFQPFLKLYP